MLQKKHFNNFKSMTFHVINQDKTVTPEPTPFPTLASWPEPTLEDTHDLAPNQKAFDTPQSRRKISPLKFCEKYLNEIENVERKNQTLKE